MATDPRTTIDRAPMSRFQWTVVAVMIGLNALDGFDVLSISFASPGIARDWGIDRGALGFVLSMELIGMAAGSLLLGGVADRVGRRLTILGCLVGMAFGMFGAASAHDVVQLSIWRSRPASASAACWRRPTPRLPRRPTPRGAISRWC
ncbi:MAG: transporter [Sphingomonas bacterium]|nr:transporter [Sphingomonas bacterium]